MIAMPSPGQAVLARRAEIVAALRRIVPAEGVIDAEHERRAFECDGLTAYRQLPMVVVLPEATARIVEVLRYCSANNVKVVPPAHLAVRRRAAARWAAWQCLLRIISRKIPVTLKGNPLGANRRHRQILRSWGSDYSENYNSR
jgi:hypothetical protein